MPILFSYNYANQSFRWGCVGLVNSYIDFLRNYLFYQIIYRERRDQNEAGY